MEFVYTRVFVLESDITPPPELVSFLFKCDLVNYFTTFSNQDLMTIHSTFCLDNLFGILRICPKTLNDWKAEISLADVKGHLMNRK